MVNYIAVEPSLENCTLVEGLFEGIESLYLNPISFEAIEGSKFKLTFEDSNLSVFFSSNDGFETLTLDVLNENDTLLDTVVLGEFDDAISISGFLCRHFHSNEAKVNDVVDEESEVQTKSWRTSGVSTEEVISIVPDAILDCRVVALVYDNNTIAYRFKTNVGSFDMSRDVASQYGLAPDKVTKFTRLMLVNDIFMTKGEYEAGRLIPDISNSKVDCDRLFKALFRG